MGAQYLLGHRGAQFGIDPRHQHGIGAKRLEHPFAEYPVAVDKSIPHPQTDGERRAHAAAAEERAVGCRGESGVDLGLNLCEMVVTLRRVIGGLLQADIELVGVGDAPGGGAGGKDDRGKHDNDV